MFHSKTLKLHVNPLLHRFEAADNDEKFDDAVKKIKKDDKENSKK